ncbi:hypothetical protein CRE_10525 [Caenorhabditis remanei]|uniref:F-box domain-containing protein n=1 Tax=Caenorhabditis remanei TaxID=31234 RepID=E3N0Q8_CAERE|nr:hypothetical protein CRE_10525 [Caenorhabditis remanei]
MTTAFPLLRLPYLVLMPVLEQMKFLDRIALSLLSKRARMYVKLLKMKNEYVNLKLNVDYILSIMDVIHCKSINRFVVSEISEHDCIPIVAKLPKIDEVVVEYDWSFNVLTDKALFQKEKRLLKVLRTVLSVSSAVTISYRFQNHNHLREILKGKFDAVILKWPDNWITLNDLWITNAKVLEIHTVKLDVRDLNRYFKLWMKNICNDRLEYLEVRIYDKTSVDLLLDGLNAVLVPIETQREFRVLGNVKRFVPGRFGTDRIAFEFDITRADGRQATIRIGTWGTVCFYVWPESTNPVPNQSSLISTFYNSCFHHFERLFLRFLLACESFFFFFSTNFNWNRDYDVHPICFYFLAVLLACWFLNSLF